VNHLKSRRRQHLDRCAIRDVRGSGAFGQGDLGVARHQVFAERRVFRGLAVDAGRGQTCEQREHHERESLHLHVFSFAG